MSLREWLNNNSTLVTVGAVLFLVVALGVVFLQMRGPSIARSDADTYFWDIDAHEPFVAPLNEEPDQAPSGGPVAQAYLFSCGECTPDQWFGYLERYTDEYHRLMREGTFNEMPMPQREQFMERNHLIRNLDDTRWIRRMSEQGDEIVLEMRRRCDSPDDLTRCRP